MLLLRVIDAASALLCNRASRRPQLCLPSKQQRVRQHTSVTSSAACTVDQGLSEDAAPASEDAAAVTAQKPLAPVVHDMLPSPAAGAHSSVLLGDCLQVRRHNMKLDGRKEKGAPNVCQVLDLTARASVVTDGLLEQWTKSSRCHVPICDDY